MASKENNNEEVNEDEINDDKYLYAIIRKPQEGKTFICLENLRKNNKHIHFIATMNTIKSNNQFLERTKVEFGNKVCVFNSSKKDLNNCRHAKTVNEVIHHIKNNGCKIIIFCAHQTRFKKSLFDLIEEIDDSKKIKENIMIHIDEAHAYIPSYRSEIIAINQHHLIDRIYLYTATPLKLWSDEDILFKRIYIVDIEEQFEIIKSEHYFGVKDCNIIEIDCNNLPQHKNNIKKSVIRKYIKNNNEQQKLLAKPLFYSEKYPFSLGNEVKYLTNIKYMLYYLKNNTYINNNKYSYNFIPAFQRKITHYQTIRAILSVFKNAIVFVINGDGSQLYFYMNNIKTRIKMINNNETSNQIEYYMNKYGKNRPYFITGFHCIGMSVTFINESIGNFDNVIFNHEHYQNQPDVLYQLCRFLFNYINWKDKTKIKRTNLFCSNKKIIDICINYEYIIDIIDTELKGSIRTQEEVAGKIPLRKKKKPRELKHNFLEKYVIGKPTIKTFTVENGNDKEIYEKMRKYYADFKCNGDIEQINPKAMPKINKDGFYECSITNKKSVHFDPSSIKSRLKKLGFYATYQLVKNTYKYIRIFVAYQDKSDNTDYTWFVRTMELKKCNEVAEYLENI